MNSSGSVTFIGFGEAGGILGAALAARGLAVTMYDVRLEALREVGLEPFMSEACARLQDEVVDRMGEQRIDYADLPVPFDWKAFFDALPGATG